MNDRGPSRRRSKRLLVPFLGLSVLTHGLAILLVVATGAGKGCGTLPPGATGVAVGPGDLLDPEGWDAACVVDEVLAAAAGGLSCLRPGLTDVGRCLAQSATLAEGAATACRRFATPLEIALVPIAPLAPPETSEEDKKKAEEAKKPEENPDVSGQVVDIARPEVEIRPDEAKFLSEFDSKVDKETKSRVTGEKPTPAVPATPPQPPQPKEDPGRPKENASPESKGAGSLAMRSPDPGKGSKLDRAATSPGGAPEGFDAESPDGLGPKKGDGQAEGPVDRPAEPKGGGDGKPMPSLAELRPTQEALARAVGTGSSDYLKDVDEGAETLINSKRWKYASFFNRVKRAVFQTWSPAVDSAYRLRDPTGQIYGHKNRLTVLKISLHPDGKIRDIVVEKPCGIDFLDDVAVSAFRQAQPFPNPPDGLVDKASNLITFRFGFYLELTEGTKLRVFRYGN